MVNIPTNSRTSQKDALINKIVEYLKQNTTYSSYRASDCLPLSLVKDVCREFYMKGYHCKIVYFCDGRSAYQSFHVSKEYLQETCARMVYSEIF